MAIKIGIPLEGTIKKAASEIDPEVIGGLDDILNTQDAQFAKVAKNLAALKGFRESIATLIRSVDKMIIARQEEMTTIGRRHRIILSKEEILANEKVYKKYASRRYSPTMKSLEQNEKEDGK